MELTHLSQKGSFLNIVSTGFALELFWFLATENTDFLYSFFPSFSFRFFNFQYESFADDFIIPLVTAMKFFSLISLCSLQSVPCDPPLNPYFQVSQKLDASKAKIFCLLFEREPPECDLIITFFLDHFPTASKSPTSSPWRDKFLDFD